jgi:hypothetical protein
LIRRSKIYHSIKNNSSSQFYPHENNYRPQTSILRHRRIRRKIFNGAGDEKLITPYQKQIDFTELEKIFDNAIRNRLSLELYKEKSQTQNENLHKLESVINNKPIDTRIELSTVEPIEEIKCCLIYNIKQHKILSVIFFITLSTLIGFFSIFIFVIK